MTTPTTARLAIAALLATSGLASAAAPAWKNPAATSDALTLQRPDQVRSALAFAAERAQASPYVIVRVKATPDSPARLRMSRRGLTLLSPLSADTYFARIDQNADTPNLAPSLAAVTAITRAHKQHPMIARAEFPEWSVVGNAQTDTPTVALYAKIHDDVSAADPALTRQLTALGIDVRNIVSAVNTLVLELPADRVDTITDIPAVQWVEPPIPAFGTFNDSNRAATQVNTVNSAPYNLDGSGVTVFVYDAGTVRASHNDFSGRATIIDSDSINFHATHVAGTIAGDGSSNPNHRGMAPAATILSAGFEQPGGLSQGFLYTDPGDLEADYANALALGADISNNSIGSNVASNFYPCSWEGDYGLTAATIDAVARGSLGEPITIFWAAGNERGAGTCGTFYGTTPPPSNNKNAISIGALNSNDNSMTSFSSWGPADDGRLRPVLSAPGCQSGSDGGVTSTDSASNTAYTTLCGTSMASPTAAGIGALLLQDFRATFPSRSDPSNQLTKALLVHTAQDILNQGPDHQSGYGLIQAKDAIDHTRTGAFDEREVDQGAVETFSIAISDQDPELKVTLVWDDAPGTPNAASALVNDLDLVVISPSGTRHYPWTLDQTNPGNPATRTAEDHLNNIEQVLVDNPEPGLWEIAVEGTSVPQGPQSFAITATPDLGQGLLSLVLTETPPQLVLPQTPIDVAAQINLGIDTFVEGSAVLHYRAEGTRFTQTPMTHEGAGLFSAVIPGANCNQTIEYYVSAQGVEAGTVNAPPAGASAPVTIEIGELVTLLTDTMETDNGWTTSSDAASGTWERGVPVDCADRGAPSADADGSGQCWLTDNRALPDCNTDIDNGTVTLTSPTYNLASGADFTYDYWFSDIPTGAINGDAFTVDVSTNGGATWTRVRTVTTAVAAWRTDTISVGDEVPASSTVRFRFSADDAGNQNVIEAGLDNIRVTALTCEDTQACPADLDGSGILNFGDVTAFLSLYSVQNPAADLDNSGTLNFGDVTAFLALYAQGCP